MKVLIAEDDLMIADLLEVALIRGDYKVCGIARTVSQAVQIAEVARSLKSNAWPRVCRGRYP